MRTYATIYTQVLNPGNLPIILQQCEVMVMGADVTHPAPDQMGNKPSIAAVVASTEPAACEMSQYGCQVRLQMGKGGRIMEAIQDMQEIVTALLKNFYKCALLSIDVYAY